MFRTARQKAFDKSGCCFRRAFIAAPRPFALIRAFAAGLRLLALAVILGMALHYYVRS